MAVTGGVLYHVSQKSIPKQVSPLATIIIAYATGMLCCFVALMLVTRNAPLMDSLRAANWAVWMLGVSTAVIEISILLAYRSGWNISVTSVVVNISVALVLLPIGLLAFRENVSWINAAGIACCLLGLFLLSQK
jgi:uncharacterized membrane protein YdcZ (DUF606 family)